MAGKSDEQQEGAIYVPFEMPKAKEIRYADLGPARKYDPDKSFTDKQPEREPQSTPLDVEKMEMALAQERAKRRPPNLREATDEARCGSCVHFHDGGCDLFDGFPVEAGQVCDSYKADIDL